VDCATCTDLAPEKVCCHQPDWTERYIDELVAECVRKPTRMRWIFTCPKSDANTAEWREFVTNIIMKGDGRPMDKTRAQKLTQEWMLEYDMMETDSSMLTGSCYNWKVILENLRVRGIDTTSLTDEQNGIAGIAFPGGGNVFRRLD
jgi:hypothetical protein